MHLSNFLVKAKKSTYANGNSLKLMDDGFEKQVKENQINSKQLMESVLSESFK